MLTRTIIFLVINFGGLYLGSLFTNSGVSSEWYTNLNKAPWTPPGWVFGAAWTTIMICFSFLMAKLSITSEIPKTELSILYLLQVILNIGWNPAFFHYKAMSLGFVIIVSLTVVVSIIGWRYKSLIGSYALLILPYFIWLCIADSLNLYAVLNN